MHVMQTAKTMAESERWTDGDGDGERWMEMKKFPHALTGTRIRVCEYRIRPSNL